MHYMSVTKLYGMTKNDETGREFGVTGYGLQIEDIPLWRKVVGTIYHFYDMNAPRRWQALVGKAAEVVRPPRGIDDGWRNRDLPWQMRQDIRCYELNNGQTEVWVNIDRKAYEAFCATFNGTSAWVFGDSRLLGRLRAYGADPDTSVAGKDRSVPT